jgi:putative ABC transport system permease protein
MDLTPRAVTAALVGLKSRIDTFGVQRFINEYPEEPLSAVLPGAALLELWSIVGAAETALLAVSAVVVLTAILGMVAMIFSTLNERRREMAILRSVGARPLHIFLLLVAEAGTLAVAGVILGIVLTYAVLAIANPIIDQRFGLYLPLTGLSVNELAYLAAVIVAGLVAGTLPAVRAYLNSLADGVVVRI